MNSSAAYQDAAIELGKSIALGAVPFLGQAIDAYDTVESAVRWYENSDAGGEALDEAKFDFVLSLIGWIPGPGDGVKKSLRLVNKDPDYYAPVLFDLLRFVLSECGIKTSPEALLTQLFDASRLRSAIGDIREAVEDSSAFDVLPDDIQGGILRILDMSSNTMPELVDLVARRIAHWKGRRANNSAGGHARNPNGKAQPGSEEQKKGKQDKVEQPNRPTEVKAGEGTKNDKMKEKKPDNARTGVAGEHIADYICAQQFGWGKNWVAHDKGRRGDWTVKPSASNLGKLSNNTKLFKRTDPPNGTGIDAVWRADRNNGDKPFAIVEAKASGVGKRSKKTTKGKASGTNTAPFTSIVKPSAYRLLGDNSHTIRHGGEGPLLVQMSREWVAKNLVSAVGLRLAGEIRKRGYGRHLFYSPHWHPSFSPRTHMELPRSAPESKHRGHAAFYYGETEIKEYVNKRKESLGKKHQGHDDTLGQEL